MPAARKPTLESVLQAVSRERLFDLAWVLGASIRETNAGEMVAVVRFGSAFAELALCALLWICFLALRKTTRTQRDLLAHIDQLEAQHGDKCC